MIRPTCSSVYSEKPAKTSAMRANSFFSSALSVFQGRTRSGPGMVLFGIGLIGLVAFVEHAFVLIGISFGGMVRRVVGAGAEPHEPGLGRVCRLLIPQHRDGLVGQILREVVALFR